MAIDATLLWCPARTNEETAAAWALWQDGQKWEWPGLGLAPIAVPAVGSINWLANPYSNQSHYMYFHGLVFLLAPSYGMLSAGASAATYKPLIRDYILSWIANNSKAANPQAWTEETIPRRVAVMSYLFHRHLDGTAYIDAAQTTTITNSIAEQALELSALIDNPQYADDNHGFMHRLGLYDAAVAFPAIPNATTLRAKARTAAIDSIPLLFDATDGAGVEQADGYQHVNAAFVMEAITLFANFGEPITGGAASILTKVAQWGALNALPNDKLAARGDTSVGSALPTATINSLRSAGYDSPEAQYVMTKGGGGSKPAAAYLWQSSGYALFRPDWTPGAWSKDTALYIGCWLAKISHGHFHPGGHFVLYSNGQTLLEDSGGPYVYGDSPAQRYFISPEAHNQVVVNGAAFTTTSATVEAFGSNAGASWITLSHTGFAGCTIRRTIAIDHAGKAVVVVDDVTCSQARDIDLLWHLPASAALTASGARQVADVGGTAALGVDVADLSAGIVQGVNDANGNALQGWVAPGYLQRSAAPVLTYRKTGTAARFVTVLQPVANAAALLPVTISQSAGDVVAKVGDSALIVTPTAVAIVKKDTAVMAKYRRITPDTAEVEKFATTMSGPYMCTQAPEPSADTLTGDAVRMTVNAGQANAYFDRSLGTGYDLSHGGHLTILANILDDVAANAQLGVDCSNTIMSTGSVNFKSLGAKKGWNVVCKRTGASAGWGNYAAGVGSWANVKYFRYRATNLPGVRIVWEHAYYGGFHRPCIMIGLDGGFSSHATLAVNALQTAGLEGAYMAVDPANVGAPGYASAAAVAAVAAAGIEILGAVSVDAAASKALSDQHRGSGVVWASAPTDAEIAAVGTAKWGSYKGAAENYLCGFGNLNPLRHNSYALGGVTLSTAKARVDAALSSGELLIFSVPAMVTGGTGGAAPVDTTTWYAEDLAALAQYIAGFVRQGRCESKTPAAWLKSVA